jgi:hypothetical protein
VENREFAEEFIDFAQISAFPKFPEMAAPQEEKY